LSTHWDRHDVSSRYASLLTAPRQPRADLYARIDARVELMFASGLVEEVEGILASGVPPDAHALKAIGYREVVGMLRGEIDREEAIDLTKRSSRQLAKRQLTWLRNLREGTLHWVPAADEGGALEIVALWNRRFDLTEGGR
jgi:tRNA dimethylallyltransferase